MDFHVIEDLNNCIRTVHEPVKHPDNPLIKSEDFENGDVSTTQFGHAMNFLMQGPFIVKIFHDETVMKSGLSDDEKAEASLTLQRFARGVSEGSISTTALQASTSFTKDQKPTDDEIRAIIDRGLGTTQSRELIAASEVADLLLDLRLLLATTDADLEAAPTN